MTSQGCDWLKTIIVPDSGMLIQKHALHDTSTFIVFAVIPQSETMCPFKKK